MNYLSIDVGTTGCKCQLFSESGEILKYLFEEYDFKKIEGKNYVDTDEIFIRLKKMIGEVVKEDEINSICISSLGECFVLLDENDDVLFYPMLYTDPRGEEEAKAIREAFSDEEIFKVTGTTPHSMYSISKLLWIKNNYPDLFSRADKAMLVCDYIGYLLTGKRNIDYGLAARTGAFDVEQKCFSKKILSSFSIPESLFSTPTPAGTVVGKVKKELLDELKIFGEPVLVMGSHDQICTALGAGVLSEGDTACGMGTVECLTVLFKGKPESVKMGREGYVCVPFVRDGYYCTYMLNYSCSSITNWYRKKIMHSYMGDEDNYFKYIEKDITSTPSGIITLPYFSGASTPYQDLNAKGVIVNLTTETEDYEVFQSIMEGTAMEMRLNAETIVEYGIELKNTVATGGGANSEKWLQIKADVQNIPIKTLRSSEGGLCGCAMLQAVALGTVDSLEQARDIFVRYKKEFFPRADKHEAYESQYQKYKKLYKLMKEMF